MISSGLKPETLKEMVQVHISELRGVPVAVHLSPGPTCVRITEILTIYEDLGSTLSCWPDTGARTWGLHGDFDTQVVQSTLLGHPANLLGCRNQTGLASFAGGEMQVTLGPSGDEL